MNTDEHRYYLIFFRVFSHLFVANFFSLRFARSALSFVPTRSRQSVSFHRQPYLIDDASGDEIVHRPSQILRRDAIHRRAHTKVGREQANVFVGKLFLQPKNQIQLRADCPFEPDGAIATVLMIKEVEPFKSEMSTTSRIHSG
jgi:hypothetical protein